MSEKPNIGKTDEESVSSMSKFNKYTEPKDVSVDRQVLKSVPFDKYFEWYLDSYTAGIKPIVSNGKTLSTSYNDGMIKRITNISTLKFINLFDMIANTIVVFKLYDYNLRKEVNYGNLMYDLIDNIPEEVRKTYGKECIFGNVIFRYYSASGSFVSCDGEYRSRMARYWDFIRARNQFPELWNEVETYVSKIKVVRQWSTYPVFFHSDSDINTLTERNLKIATETIIKNEFVASNLLTIAWFHTVFNEMLGLTEAHLNPTFKEIFLHEIEIDKQFIQQLIKKYGSDNVELFKVLTSHYNHPITGTNKTRYIPVGYKMIPLTIKDVQDPLRLKYKPWREYFISNKCNTLIINQIAPGFPIISDWFYIRNSNKGLFDNKSQFERMKNSELAKELIHMLYDAQRGTYFATANVAGINKTDEQIKQWVSSKFKKLNDKISDPISYAIEEIIMSDVTLGFSTEFVGRTFADSMTLINSNKMYDGMLGKPFSDSGYDYFAKYMFEICYNLLTINSRLGVMHGDFHLNNATIGFLYNSIPDAKVAYFISEEPYLFHNNGYFSCIIDFSRAIINPDTYEVLTDRSLPEKYKLVKDYDKFATGESNTLLNLYLQIFPGKAKQREELSVLFKNHFPAVFKLLTALDLYMFCIRLMRMLNQTDFNVSAKAKELLDKISRMAEKYIASDMNHLLNDQANMSEKILTNDFPVKTIIEKCFAEYKISALYKKIGVVTDMYDINNPMKYSLDKYSDFPDVLRESRYYVGNTKTTADIEPITQKRKLIRSNHERERLNSLDLIQFIANKYISIAESGNY